MRDALWPPHRGPLPPDEMERLECERYHCRPSELDEEDEWTLQTYRVLRARRYELEHPKGVGRR